MTGTRPLPLLDEVRSALGAAREVLDEALFADRLDALGRRLDEPLRVAIAGRVKAGKSTLLNALVGQELAATDAGECTRIVTWYRHGHTYRVTMQPRQGPPRQVPFTRDVGAIDVQLRDTPAEDVEFLTVEWPAPQLDRMTLIDTPGIGSLSTARCAPSVSRNVRSIDSIRQPSEAQRACQRAKARSR